MTEKLKKKQKVEELGEIIYNAAKIDELACALNLTEVQVWASVAKTLAEELLQIHSLEPSVEEMREVLNKIYIARNYSLSHDNVHEALKQVDCMLCDKENYN